MSDEIAIKVEHVSKNFVLPHEKISSVKSAFTSVYKKKNKTRETQHALKDISFEVKRGEFFGIVGRNGSGKSTMLKILAGIYQPTKGSMQTKGKLVPFIELGVGFNPELTGRENVYLNGAMLGFSRKEVEAMYDDIVAFAELERFMDQKLKNYSSGMQVRLAFSMATRSDADILLIDEVLAVGDADFQRKCFNYFKGLKRNKTTVVFVSHDMDAVREYCDRAVLINEAKLVQAGSSSEIAGAYTKLFLDQADGEMQNTAKRWGDNTAVIAKPKAHVDPDNIRITFNVRAIEAIERGILGFSVKDAQDRSIVSTNTKLNRDEPINVSAGNETTVSYSFANLLNDGQYKVDIAVLDDTGSSVKDWWQDAISIIIKKEHHLPAIVNCPVIFTEGDGNHAQAKEPS